MIKNTLILFLIIFLASPLFAQEVPDVEEARPSVDISHEIGLNATSLLKQIINLSDTTIATSPYLVTYKLMFNNKIGLRCGLGAKYKRSEDTVDGFDDSTVNTERAFDVRLGVEWQKQLAGKWRLAFGGDVIAGSSLDKIVVDTGFDVVTFKDETSSYGAGPVLGLYFDINKSISLYTEAAAYFTTTESSSSQQFKNFPEFDDESNKREINAFEFQLPTTLYLTFTF